jgi:hypothetical protein
MKNKLIGIQKMSSFAKLSNEQISKIKGGLVEAGLSSCTTGSSNGCESTARCDCKEEKPKPKTF